MGGRRIREVKRDFVFDIIMIAEWSEREKKKREEKRHENENRTDRVHVIADPGLSAMFLRLRALSLKKRRKEGEGGEGVKGE